MVGVVGWGVGSDMWSAWKFTSQFQPDLWRLYEKFFKVTYPVASHILLKID